MNDTKAESMRRQVVAVAVPVGAVILVWLTCVAWTDLDMGGAWYALGLATLPVMLAGVLTTEAMARRWALDRGARIEGVALGVLHRQVLFARVGRTAGVFGAFALSVMMTAYYNTHAEQFRVWWDRWQRFEDAGGVFALAALAYVAVTAVVEVTKPRLDAHASTAAVLDRRELVDMLDLGLRRVMVVFAALAGLATAAWTVVRIDSGTVRPSPWPVFVLAVGLVALAAGMWMSRRRQRASDEVELAVEELTRTASVNAVVGAAVAMFSWYTVAASSLLFNDDPPWWIVLPGVLLVYLGIGVWFGAGTKFVFRTKRIDSLRAAA